MSQQHHDHVIHIAFMQPHPALHPGTFLLVHIPRHASAAYTANEHFEWISVNLAAPLKAGWEGRRQPLNVAPPPNPHPHSPPTKKRTLEQKYIKQQAASLETL